MRSVRLVTALLTMCLLLSVVGMAVLATDDRMPQLELDGIVSFSATKEAHVIYYSFTAQTDGTYVLYDIDGGVHVSYLTVYADHGGSQNMAVADGLSRVSFEAEEGVTYLLRLDCFWAEGAQIEYRFRLCAPVEVEDLSFSQATLHSGFVGSKGRVYLVYAPLGAAAPVTWTSSDPEVLTVTGDAGGAEYLLVGPGTAQITAATEDGKSASFEVTVKAVDPLELDTEFQYSLSANEGRYRESEHYFSFTPAVSGTYVLSVDLDPTLEMYHEVRLSTGSGSGSTQGGRVLQFEAQAGKPCYLKANFWGMYDRDAVYTFLVQSCVGAEKITLQPGRTAGYTGTSVDVQVLWEPEHSLHQELRWVTSDPYIVDISKVGTDYATLDLLSPGTVTISATTSDGVTDSFELTVYEAPVPIALSEGKGEPVMLLGGGAVEISFTPVKTGYYRLTCDTQELEAYLYADSTDDGDTVLYYMEAGMTYQGHVDNRGKSIAEGDLFITQDQVLVPISMVITKEPDNTEYLRASVKDVWTYQLLAGLKMDIRWTDGSKTTWSFDEEGPYVGREYLDWELVGDKDDDEMELRLTCGDLTAGCKLKILDKTVEALTLVDEGVLQVVERSCGMDMGDGSWYYSPYIANMRQIQIRFNDGSVVEARPDQLVYGIYVTCEDSQARQPWGTGGKDTVTYRYGDRTVELEVEIIESPVEKIELIRHPQETFHLKDRDYFYGDGAYYFAPKDLRGYLEGLQFRIFYKDGTTKDVTEQEMSWEQLKDVAYPCYEGYPLGLFGELMLGNEMIDGPCEKEGLIEYMGCSVSYTITITDEDPPQDPGPVEPSEPSEPVEPSEPSEPVEPSEPSGPSEPSEPSEPVESTEPSEPSEPTKPAGPTVPERPTGPQPTEPKKPTAATKPSSDTQLSEDPTDPTEPSEAPVQSADPRSAIVAVALVAVVCILVAVALARSKRKEG